MELNPDLSKLYTSLPWYKKHNIIIAWFVVGLFLAGLTWIPIAINASVNEIYFKPKTKDLELRKWSMATKSSIWFFAILSTIMLIPGIREWAMGR